MIRDQIKKEIEKVLVKLNLKGVEFVVEHPEDMTHGDFSCNVALSQKNPKKLAKKIVEKLSEGKLKNIASEISMAGPGFINISIQKQVLIKEVERVLKGVGKYQVKWGRKVMLEYAHPNTHKQFHIGHLRNICLGESMARLLEAVGVEVVRVNYQGDVGLHIAKAMWGIESTKKDFNLVQKNSIFDKVKYLGQAYAKGAQVYEKDEKAKKEIIGYNQQIYKSRGEIIEIYKQTRQWSLDYFDLIYKRLGTKFDRFYFESECSEGLETAKKLLKKGILTKSKGAVVFKGKKYGLDTRVFINSLGLGTYEAKELGLAPMQFKEYPDLDKIIHVVGPEQKSFFKVTFKVEELMDEKIFKNKQYHRVYELVDLKGGKMSSRKGEVVTGWWLLDEANKKIKQEFKVEDELAEKIGVGAVKYGFLKVSPMQKIAFDIKEAVSLNGNSGPYLQYTYARCQSVLKKSDMTTLTKETPLLKKEGDVLRMLYRFEEVVVEAAEELAPNLVGNFLYELAQKYNSFYNKCPILKADNEEQKNFRLWLTKVTGTILKQGLEVLGIEVLEKM